MAFTGFLTGRLGRDPELKYLDNGGMVANFTVAVRQPKKQGEERPARWVRVAIWGKTAEYVGNHCRKGDGVICYGRIELPTIFTDRNGQTRVAEQFTADQVEKWGERQGDAQPAATRPAPQPLPAPAPAPTAQELDLDDEIPF